MSEAMGTPRRVLAVADDTDDQIALRSAAALADRYGAALEVFACVEPPHDIGVLARLANRTPDRLIGEMSEHRRARIEAQIEAHLPGRPVGRHLRTGKTFVEVIRHVIANDIDFVVKAAEPLTGLDRFLFASTDQHLLRKCPCPVWLQTEGADPAPSHVLAAVDIDAWDAAEPETLFSLNRRVIDTARRIAAPTGAKITVLHAWDAMGDGMVWAFSSKGDARATADAYVNAVLDARHKAMDKLLRDVSADERHGAGIELAPRLIRGAPERVIEEQSRALGADVVVMGTVARTGLSGVFIGNTAENIINSLACPVVAVKPEGFVSPLAGA
ncbi:MAG: universal stress protein [Paracoccaceae bacterium]|nr:universal stress protein [Paracoccaceae bacterium]